MKHWIKYDLNYTAGATNTQRDPTVGAFAGFSICFSAKTNKEMSQPKSPLFPSF